MIAVTSFSSCELFGSADAASSLSAAAMGTGLACSKDFDFPAGFLQYIP